MAKDDILNYFKVLYELFTFTSLFNSHGIWNGNFEREKGDVELNRGLYGF